MAPRRTAAAPTRSAIGQDRYLQLFEALSPLIGSHCVEDICLSACSVVAGLLEVENCSIFLHRPETGKLALLAATHIPKEEWASVHLPTDSGLGGRVFTTGQSLLLRKNSDFEAFGMKPRSSYGRASCIVVPLVLRGTPHGVINLANPRRSRLFTERDVKLIEAAARLISGGIQNAFQFRETVQIHEHLEEIFDNLHVGIVALDGSLRVTHSNGRFRAMLGGGRSRLKGMDLRSFLDPTLYNVSHRLIREAAEKGTVAQDRLETTLADQARLFEITASRVGGCAGGPISSCLLMIEDIGKEAEVARLREADSIKGAFLRMISHELRTPLTVINGTMPLLHTCCEEQNGAAGVKLKKVQTLLSTNIVRMTGLVNTILDVVEIENGSLKLAPRSVDLNDLVREKVGLIEERAKTRKISVELTLDAALPAIHADRQRVGQAIYELLDNALKFSPEGSPIRVQTAPDGGMAAISISNLGAPIPKKNRSDVFEKFHQIDGSTTRKAGGCGLGLYLARNVTEMHGGTIQIVDGGSPEETVFLIRLPVEKAADVS